MADIFKESFDRMIGLIRLGIGDQKPLKPEDIQWLEETANSFSGSNSTDEASLGRIAEAVIASINSTPLESA